MSNQTDNLFNFEADFNLVENPLFLSISEAAKISGVNGKTIRRAIQGKKVNYIIVHERYLIDAATLFKFIHSNTKLINKFYQCGLGQYFLKNED